MTSKKEVLDQLDQIKSVSRSFPEITDADFSIPAFDVDFSTSHFGLGIRVKASIRDGLNSVGNSFILTPEELEGLGYVPKLPTSLLTELGESAPETCGEYGGPEIGIW